MWTLTNPGTIASPLQPNTRISYIISCTPVYGLAFDLSE